MPQNPQRLELTWIGKGEEPQLEPRILIEDTEKSYGDPASENMLIHGDNLLALKALEQEYAGKVKCIYIDPPYNTGSAFESYDDGREHSIWLQMIKLRLNLLKKLLSDNGSIWISIDDNEVHYLKVLCDEIFGRSNFIESVVWQKIYSVKNSAKFLSGMHEYLLVYSNNIDEFQINLLPRSEKANKGYTNPDNDPRGRWTTNAVQARNYYSQGSYQIVAPSGRIHVPPTGTYWRVSEDNFKELANDGRIYWGKSGDSIPRIKKFLSEVKQGMVAPSFWSHQEVGQYAEAKAEVRELFKNQQAIFETPKPEKLIERVLTLTTGREDLVLDSFLGSGTTAAVAHKMGRRWIGIELGEHANTHCLPRLKKVVDGLDEGGITKSVDWKGGGGFKFYNLAPSLLRQDDFGNWVIDDRYNPDMLAAAMAKQEGYRYAPDETRFWKQARSTENDYLFTTTQLVTVELVDRIADQLGKEESLLICCKSFQKEAGKRDPRIDVKKIPSTLLGRCEFGKDDYSLSIVDVPTEGEPETFEPAARKAEREAREEQKRKYGAQAKMFGSS